MLTVFALFPFGVWAQEQTATGSTETGFYYTVQQGDTLWDICKKLFGNPDLWPDLWGKNSQLTNPHWIYPGNRLHIYQRDGRLYVEKVEEAQSAEAQHPPAPQHSSPSESPYFLYSSMDQVGFIRTPPVSPVGTIFKSREDKNMISTGDVVYIRSEGSQTMTEGSLFTVFRTFEPIKNPQDKKAVIGSQHYLVGIVRITQQETGYVLATVVENYRTIELNDKVMPYEEKSPKILLPETTAQVNGSILLSEEQSELIGENTIAFIDKGEQDGISTGQQYRLYYQEKEKLSPKAKEAVLLPSVTAGTILVLHTEQTTATVLVTNSSPHAAPGIQFGPIAAP